jgi:hypothetical protein
MKHVIHVDGVKLISGDDMVGFQPKPECYGHRELERNLPPSEIFCHLCLVEDQCIDTTFQNVVDIINARDIRQM